MDDINLLVNPKVSMEVGRCGSNNRNLRGNKGMSGILPYMVVTIAGNQNLVECTFSNSVNSQSDIKIHMAQDD